VGWSRAWAELDAAVAEANRWLEGQAEVRRDLFARLDEAVAARRTKQIRELLARVNATASHDRTDTEDVIAAAAADYMTAFTSEAYERVRDILDDLSRTGRHLQPAQMRPLVEKAIQAAADAGSLTGDREAIQIAYWKERAGLNQPTSPPRPGPPGRYPPETSSSPEGGICTSRWHADTGSREAARAATPAMARTVRLTTRPAPARCGTFPMTSGSSRSWKNERPNSDSRPRHRLRGACTTSRAPTAARAPMLVAIAPAARTAHELRRQRSSPALENHGRSELTRQWAYIWPVAAACVLKPRWPGQRGLGYCREARRR
jgi:hypothetical protein